MHRIAIVGLTLSLGACSPRIGPSASSTIIPAPGHRTVAAAPAAPAPAAAKAVEERPAMPAVAQPIQLRCEDHTAQVDIVQNGKTIAADSDGIFHLDAAPFGLRIRGDVENVGFVASQSPGLVKTFAAEKRPIITLVATNSVYADGDFFINNDNRLTPWTQFQKYFGTGFEAATKLLTGRLQQSPVVIDGSLQYPCSYAPENARDYLFPAKNLFRLDGLLTDDAKSKPPAAMDWSRVGDIYMVLYIESAIDKDSFCAVGWKPVHLRFERH